MYIIMNLKSTAQGFGRVPVLASLLYIEIGRVRRAAGRALLAPLPEPAGSALSLPPWRQGVTVPHARKICRPMMSTTTMGNVNPTHLPHALVPLLLHLRL